MIFDRRVTALRQARQFIVEALASLDGNETNVAAKLRDVIAYIDDQLSR